MSDVVIVFDGVWKKFRKGERHDSLRDLIPWTAKALFHRAKPAELRDQEFWAVRDVSFEVKRGEALGIIGPNGAGKSTILKLLTKILRPTRGECFVRGRAGALIEIAAGFHPDLTGRENVYLQGAIMGMKRQEIATRFDEIVQFAGVGDFVDTPVKRYSSGMNARLGFAVAAHLEPDVLIIDEVLSVGDVTFQQRCLEKMKEFREKGVAIAFVSHNLDAVFSLCSQAILLSRGTVRAAGSAADVLDAYRAGPTTPARSAPNGPALTLVLAESSSGSHLSCLPPGDGIKLRVILAGLGVPTEECFVGMTLWDRLTGAVLHNSHVRAPRAGSDCSHDRIELDFRFCCSLLKGRYRVGFDVFHSQTQSFLLKEDYVCDFEVVENYSYAGIVHIDPEWLFQRTD